MRNSYMHFAGNTYFRLVSSFPKKWITTVLKTKLENTVNNPAIPVERQRRCFQLKTMWKTLNRLQVIKEVSVGLLLSRSIPNVMMNNYS